MNRIKGFYSIPRDVRQSLHQWHEVFVCDQENVEIILAEMRGKPVMRFEHVGAPQYFAQIDLDHLTQYLEENDDERTVRDEADGTPGGGGD